VQRRALVRLDRAVAPDVRDQGLEDLPRRHRLADVPRGAHVLADQVDGAARAEIEGLRPPVARVAAEDVAQDRDVEQAEQQRADAGHEQQPDGLASDGRRGRGHGAA
jgi:hypothetical protein